MPKKLRPKVAAKKSVKRATPSAPRPPRRSTWAATSGLALRTPTREFPLSPPGKTDEERLEEIRRAARHWAHVLRNRERWAGLAASATNQGRNALATLERLGLTAEMASAIIRDGVVEVVIPFRTEQDGWEIRTLPWEYLVAGATREQRGQEPLTVVRQLSVGTPPAPRRPARVLYVESTPGRIGELYDFRTERDLVLTNLRAKPKESVRLSTPTAEELERTVKKFEPDIVHLAGFDCHQGLRLAHAGAKREGSREAEWDGYLVADDAGRPAPLYGQDLARILCSASKKPELVAFNIQNSAARLAPLAVAAGASAAIGFQDVFDDELAELFYGSFYRKWRKSDWDLTEAFRESWKTVRAQAVSLRGSGLVLWSARPLVAVRGAARALPRVSARRAAAPRPVLLPSDVTPSEAPDILKISVEPLEEMNYALLHNRRPLFKKFTVINASAEHKGRDVLAEVRDIDVRVALSVGPDTATYDRRLSIDTTSVDLSESIHVPLTSDLMRSVRESINTSLRVEVGWGPMTLHRESRLVRLLPVDQWRDNDLDGQWLPSFVLPRDPAVASIIDRAQQFVRVLRDDPSAGFDGYQSVDTRAPDPAADVDRQVQAVWSLIVHELGLGYVNPPPTYANALDSQRLRTPSDIVRFRAGTCIDLCLLLAACLELVDIYPVIFLLDGHAFPGYWRTDTAHDKFITMSDETAEDVDAEAEQRAAAPGAQRVPWWFRETAYGEILQQVRLGHLVPLEAVWLTEHSGFWDAVEGGRDNLKDKDEFHSMLDIARAREALVTPLPIGGER